MQVLYYGQGYRFCSGAGRVPSSGAKECQPCIAGFPDTWPLGALVDDIVPPGVRCAAIVGHQSSWLGGGNWAGAGSVKQPDPANACQEPILVPVCHGAGE